MFFSHFISFPISPILLYDLVALMLISVNRISACKHSVFPILTIDKKIQIYY